MLRDKLLDTFGSYPVSWSEKFVQLSKYEILRLTDQIPYSEEWQDEQSWRETEEKCLGIKNSICRLEGNEGNLWISFLSLPSLLTFRDDTHNCDMDKRYLWLRRSD